MDKFITNAASFTDALGVRHAPLVVWLSLIPWDDDDREAFIMSIGGGRSSNASTATSQRKPGQ